LVNVAAHFKFYRSEEIGFYANSLDMAPGWRVPMSDQQAKPGSAPRRKRPFLSIRARLLVLALLAIAPLMFDRVHGLEKARAQRTEAAHGEALAMAQRGAEAQRENIYAIRALLQVVARVYAKLPFDQAVCNQYLADVAANVAWVRSMSVASPDGRIKCSTDPMIIGINMSDRQHFQNTLKLRDFGLSDYFVNRIHQEPTLIATFPAIGDDGSIRGVVHAAINLKWVSEVAADAAKEPGASVLLLDSKGTLVAASEDAEGMIGKNFADSALVKDMQGADEGTFTAAGPDGVRRIFAHVLVPWTRAQLVVGLDDAAVHSGIDREINIAYLQLGLFGVFVLLIAWFGGEQLVVRPIRVLVRTATRFGRGDLHVRATEESWIAEFEPLAVALDDMARKLAAREEELQIANEHLEELASLDGLTGLANRRGFDREFELAFRRAGDTGQPLALMMIDIDYFKLYNDRYGHVSGDTCLRSVAETLSLVTLENAVLVARYGGEEFALLLPALDIERTTALAEEARKAIEDLLITHAESPYGHVTISVGVHSAVPMKYESPADLVEAADRALYEAKRHGRNRMVAHVPMELRAAS
jgi:diguanylate cyclase (GGDEF)-like protein